jgi:hypothetical protein
MVGLKEAVSARLGRADPRAEVLLTVVARHLYDELHAFCPVLSIPSRRIIF